MQVEGRPFKRLHFFKYKGDNISHSMVTMQHFDFDHNRPIFTKTTYEGMEALSKDRLETFFSTWRIMRKFSQLLASNRSFVNSVPPGFRKNLP